MGLFDNFFGGAKSQTTSQPVINRLPGLFEDKQNIKGQQLAGQSEALATNLANIPKFALPDQVARTQGGVFEKLQGELTDPSFNPNASEQALVNESLNQLSGNAAFRGLLPSGEAGARAVLPLLQQFRQQRLQNLAQGAGLQQNETGLGIQQRGQDITGGLGSQQQFASQQQQAIDQLNQLTQASLPQFNVGSRTTQSNTPGGIGRSALEAAAAGFGGSFGGGLGSIFGSKAVQGIDNFFNPQGGGGGIRPQGGFAPSSIDPTRNFGSKAVQGGFAPSLIDPTRNFRG